MSYERKAFWIKSLSVMAILGIIAARLDLELNSFMRRPLGPSLGFSTQSVPPLQVETPPSLSTASQPPAAIKPDPDPLPRPLCGGPAVMNILAIGSDYRYNTYLYGLSDVIKVVRVDFVTPKVMIVDFPRDLYVQIPDIALHGGITEGKLNQPFLYGNPGLGYYDGPGEGPGLLARTLDLNYGERPDHYVAVNMEVFVRLIDAVGGVDVDLPDWELGLKPGTHHMDGAQALEFSRARPNGTFARTQQQDYVLSALWNKLTGPSMFTHIANIIAAFSGSVQTDLTPEQINQLTCLAPRIPKENVVFLKWPEGMFTGTRVNDPVLGDTFIWGVDNSLIRAYVAAFNNGQWPTSQP